MSGEGRLDGRTALITGAASGIGKATVERFLAEGARVAAADANGDGLAAAFAGREPIVTVTGDVSKQEDAAGMAAAAVDAFGAIDALVNCAGIARHMVAGPATDRTRAIVNLASIEAHVVLASSGHPQVHYNASKGAVHMITRALAVELAPHGIRVNSICPGVTETPLSEFALASAEKRASIERQVPLGRVGKPEDIAAAALFLASEDASYITGEALVVDGGFMVQ